MSGLRREEPPIDHKLALRDAAQRIAHDFEGIYSTETVELFLNTSYDQFASRNTVPHVRPLLAERFARQRLVAQARIDGRRDDGRPVVLFLCVHNAGRSQMALGILNSLAGDAVIGWSGGQEPGTDINPVAVQAMAEKGIDITGEYPKPWTPGIVRAADVVITMGCGDACPIIPGKRYEDWAIDDPERRAIAEVRTIRDEIERRVRELLSELRISVSR